MQKVARTRGEVAIGYMKLGAPPVINPPQGESVLFTAADRVVVIAEDDREAVADARGGELTEPPSQPLAAPPPAPPIGPLADQRESPSKSQRSPLLPPEPMKAPEARNVAAGPRLEGPSTMPRPPLPPRGKS